MGIRGKFPFPLQKIVGATLGSPYTEKKVEFFCKKSSIIHPTRKKKSSFEQKVDFSGCKSRLLKFQKCHSVCSLHATTCVCFMLCVLTSWALWTQHTLFGSCGRSVCFLFLQFVAPILIFVVECDSRRLRS